MTHHLAEQQISLGELYAWIHRRAAYLRQRAEEATQNKNHAGHLGGFTNAVNETALASNYSKNAASRGNYSVRLAELKTGGEK